MRCELPELYFGKPNTLAKAAAAASKEVVEVNAVKKEDSDL